MAHSFLLLKTFENSNAIYWIATYYTEDTTYALWDDIKEMKIPLNLPWKRFYQKMLDFCLKYVLVKNSDGVVFKPS